MITDAIAYLFTLERLGMKFGLENVSRVCAALGHPDRAFASVLIAGTNGKGSVAAMVHRALLAAGHRVSRYTSPHLERLEERFVVGNAEIDTSALDSAAAAVRQAILDLQASGSLDTPPTFFEATTAVAFEVFRRAGVQIAVLEVGLGGRLDATNVVTPLAAAITSIDFDHEAQLGHTLEAIAFEKAGIVKPGIPVVCGPLPAAAESVVRRICAERSARFISVTHDEAANDLGNCPFVGLRGAHQLDNARVAVRLLRELNGLRFQVDERAIRTGLSDVEWPGRLELFRQGTHEVLIDAAHNPAGARALAAYIRQAGWAGCTLVFGALQDKHVGAMLAALAPVCGAIVCTTPDTPRALDAEDAAALARAVPGAGWQVRTVPQPRAALEDARRSCSRVVIAGSIFLIGPLRGILRAQ